MDSKNERQTNFSEGGGVGERRCHKLQNDKLEVFAVSYKQYEDVAWKSEVRVGQL